MSEGAPSLRGKRALVTGAGKRLGRAIALALGQRGAHVAVHYRDSAAGAEATAADIRALGGEAFTVKADLADLGAARRLVDDSCARLGALDLLVASAASFERVPFDALDDDALQRSLHQNLASPFALAHQATAALRASQGSIVFITCSSATTPYPNFLPYVVSKGALRHLMKTLALELAPLVRVNAVAPGTVLPPDDLPADRVERLRKKIPLQRLGSAEDVARAVLFLAESPFVTGEEILVDGGRSVLGVDG